MCTLWQRFGRAARDPDLEGTAMLLVEPKHLDEEREKKVVRAEAKKRKAENQGLPKTTKRRAVPSKTGQPPHAIPVAHAVAPQDEDEKRRVLYTAKKGKSVSSTEVVKVERKREIEVAMDDMINAKKRGLGCRRKPLRLFFSSDRACKCV